VFAQEPEFEVASVKSNPSRLGTRGHSFPGDRFEARNVPVMDLILVAYGEPGHLLPDSGVVGGPDWSNADRFDISAKVRTSGPNTVALKQIMLRALLRERFKLVLHVEAMPLPGYALVVSSRDGALGPQLRRADVDCDPLLASQPGQRERCILYALPSGELRLRGQTMRALANTLTILLERPVVDRTGLAGGFDADAR
jgi:uncharacterized protein (TIGR03435 family)